MIMNPRVTEVKTLEGYRLLLTFSNGEKREFDMTPYLNIGVFKELKDKHLFDTAKAFMGTVSWKNGQDLCPGTFWLESIPVRTAG